MRKGSHRPSSSTRVQQRSASAARQPVAPQSTAAGPPAPAASPPEKGTSQALQPASPSAVTAAAQHHAHRGRHQADTTGAKASSAAAGCTDAAAECQNISDQNVSGAASAGPLPHQPSEQCREEPQLAAGPAPKSAAAASISDETEGALQTLILGAVQVSRSCSLMLHCCCTPQHLLVVPASNLSKQRLASSSACIMAVIWEMRFVQICTAPPHFYKYSRQQKS